MGELARVELEGTVEGVKISTVYDTDADCLSCESYRLISRQTSCCFECDNTEFVKNVKILLGLDHD